MIEATSAQCRVFFHPRPELRLRTLLLRAPESHQGAANGEVTSPKITSKAGNGIASFARGPAARTALTVSFQAAKYAQQMPTDA